MCFKRNIGNVDRGTAWALVTGSAMGIGRQYAEQLAQRGYNLYLVDIREEIIREAEILEHAHRVKCVARVMDLAATDAAKRLHASTVAEGYEFDVVINNAGIFSHCDILKTPTERIERMITLHDLTLSMMCRLYGEDMIRRGKGRL
ncbi:MAG: SDR family NAD(P)-dependent oxidoreductase, partial [Alistipes sp.]|nr:SDR family NAD(P)-dependent oxidoreductase [Alistipes sp.]